MAGAQEEAVLQAALEAERLIDSELSRLGSLQSEDLEEMRQRRIRQRQLEWEQQQAWLTCGHGTYKELQDEKDWFAAVKRSRRVVCHFSRPTTERCVIVDKHFAALAEKRLETRFVSINAEKAPFLWCVVPWR